MAHYAFLNDENIVTEVITGNDENILIEGLDAETWYGNFRSQVCKRTSYNTQGGVHLGGKRPVNKNYAGVGYTFDGVGFAAPKPYSSWLMDSGTYLWGAPTPMPTDGGFYSWNEETLAWVESDLPA